MSVVQNINLYLPEFRLKKHWLNARVMLLLAGVSLVLLTLASGVEYWQLSRLRADRAAADVQAEQAAAATAALVEELGVQTEDLVLLDDIRELETQLQSKQTLLQFLEGRELGNAGGFSEYLADLSRYHVQGLSLKEITLEDGGRSVRLAGQVVKAELVPMYLQSLSQGATYAGTNFERLQISDSPVRASGSAGNAVAAWNFEVRSLGK
ncbi:MAG: hypothetical protein SV422_10650 [Pseudomonadota bacterium]|nr:hypothetical protein [Pseudomonadota bacterium]